MERDVMCCSFNKLWLKRPVNENQQDSGALHKQCLDSTQMDIFFMQEASQLPCVLILVSSNILSASFSTWRVLFASSFFPNKNTHFNSDFV